MTKEQALKVAACYGLKDEVAREINSGLTPEQALYEWDIIQFIRVLSKTLNCSLFINNNLNGNKGQSCK